MVPIQMVTQLSYLGITACVAIRINTITLWVKLSLKIVKVYSLNLLISSFEDNN